MKRVSVGVEVIDGPVVERVGVPGVEVGGVLEGVEGSGEKDDGDAVVAIAHLIAGTERELAGSSHPGRQGKNRPGQRSTSTMGAVYGGAQMLESVSDNYLYRTPIRPAEDRNRSPGPARFDPSRPRGVNRARRSPSKALDLDLPF